MRSESPQATSSAAPHALPSTTLIIPSRNRPEMLAETVASVLQGEEVPTELIVIDQSDAAHPELTQLGVTRGCTIRYVWSQVPGVSRARNHGISIASHGVLVFTDDDVFVTRTWFGALVRALLAAGPSAVVTGQVRPAEERDGGFVPSTIVDPEPAVYRGRIWADVLYPPNMAAYKSLFDRVGSFDLQLGAGEDNDLAYRLLEAGYSIHYVPDAIVYHRAWRSNREYLPLKWRYGFGQGVFYAKHVSLRDRYILWRLIHDVRVRGARGLRLVTSDRRRATGQLVSIAGQVTGFMKGLLTRPRRGSRPALE